MPRAQKYSRCLPRRRMLIAKRQATPNSCLPSLLGDGDKWIEIAYGEEKLYCTVPTRAAKVGHKSLVLARQVHRTNQGKIHLYSLSPHLPQFQQSAGATPLQSLLYTCMINDQVFILPCATTNFLAINGWSRQTSLVQCSGKNFLSRRPLSTRGRRKPNTYSYP